MFDPAVGRIHVKRRLAVLLIPLVARVDLPPILASRTHPDHLGNEPREVGHVRDGRIHRVG
jgi:hypothetical protein